MKFEVFQSDKSGDYYFRLKAKNGQIILSSQGYKSKAGCLNGVDSVKRNCMDDKCFDRKEAANGKYHFNLKSTNGQIVGKSQMYASNSGMENGINSVRNNAPDAILDDLSAG